jgi:nucleoside phosphorylase
MPLRPPTDVVSSATGLLEFISYPVGIINGRQQSAPSRRERLPDPILVAAAMGIELRELGRYLGRLRRVKNTALDAREAMLEGCGVILVKTGIGRKRARDALKRGVERFRPERIIMLGLAGGLRREYRTGEPFFISSASIWSGSAENAAIEQLLALDEVFSSPEKPIREHMPGGRRIHRGRLLTVDSFVSTTRVKRRLASAGFDLVDMEFASAAALAGELGLPITGLKVVADTLKHDFPRYRYSASDRRMRFPPPRLMASSLRACRVLGRLAHSWLKETLRSA